MVETNFNSGSSSKGGTFLPSWLSLGRTDHGGSGEKLSNIKSSGTSCRDDGPMPIVIGVIAPRAEKRYLEETCQRLKRLAPDRIDVRHLTSEVAPAAAAAAAAAAAETAVVALHVLVLCASKPNFPHELAQQYIQIYDPVVLTDFDTRFLQDRRIFYDYLQASCSYDNSLRETKSTSSSSSRISLLRLLPLPRAYFVPQQSSGTNSEGLIAATAIDRPEHIEINGTILFKPVLERSALILPGQEKEEFRLYYPWSAGGGCKTITYDVSSLSTHQINGNTNIISPVANYNSAIKRIRACDPNFNREQCYIYEEFNSNTSTEEGTTAAEEQQPWELSSPRLMPRRYRKRDRLRDLARNVLPDTLTGQIPSYRGDDEITAESDLSRPDRTLWIVTTAALPWMTGTAVNPLLRAAYLTRSHQSVNLVIPWLDNEKEREDLYSTVHKFSCCEDQEIYIRDWLRKSADMPDAATALKILWYPAFYHKSMMSIFAKTDICSLIQPDNPNLDAVVLEEPEHLNWFKAAGDSWTSKFSFVVGIIHTNYKAYAANANAIVGPVAATVVSGASTLMVRAYCTRVIKLSSVLQSFAPEKEVVCNVHGVRSDFIKEGKRRAEAVKVNSTAAATTESCSVYFIGKILWAKGLDRLMYLEHFYRKVTGNYFEIDIYGDGPEMPEILRAYHGRSSGRKRRAVSKFIQCFYAFGDADFLDEEEEEEEDNISKADSEPTAEESKPQQSSSKPWEVRRSMSEFELPKSIHEYRLNPIPAVFHGRKDHAQLGEQYKVFVNPSITEVLCTTTAEALAMGKFAVIPHHPSNAFFMQYGNCLTYNNKLEFVANLEWALTHEPEPLTEEQLYSFTWEAASERFIRASGVTIRESRIKAKSQKSKMDERIAFLHNQIGHQHEALKAALKGVSSDSFENLETKGTPQDANKGATKESLDSVCQEVSTEKSKNASITLSFPVVLLAVFLYHVINFSVNV